MIDRRGQTAVLVCGSGPVMIDLLGSPDRRLRRGGMMTAATSHSPAEVARLFVASAPIFMTLLDLDPDVVDPPDEGL